MQQLPTPTKSEHDDSSSPKEEPSPRSKIKVKTEPSSNETPSPSQVPSTSDSTATTLENLSWQFLDAFNARDFTIPHLLPYFSTTFTASAPGQIPCTSIAELLANRAALVAKFPHLELVFLSANTEAREVTGYAECHVFTEILGMPVGVRRQVLNVFKWRREGGGVWRCVEFTFLARWPVEEGLG